MSKIILDFGSGNTHKNNWDYLKRMIDELKAIDTGKHEIIIKHQLFLEAGENIPLDHEIFKKAYTYAQELGYQTTSSVFDKESLDFLLQFDIPFVKIANNRKLDQLMYWVPHKVPVFMSIGKSEERITYPNRPLETLLCVSKYPCTLWDYEYSFGLEISQSKLNGLYGNYSDHTTNFGLWYRYRPEIIEWHYKLGDSTGLDAGDFARTPAQLAEIL